ncbi:MAG: hypothetical protein ACLFPU_09890 [Dehalococcoidia bacterium]
MKKQKYIIIALICALVATLGLWYGEHRQMESLSQSYDNCIKECYQGGFIKLYHYYSDLVDLLEAHQETNSRDRMFEVALDNQLHAITRTSSDISSIANRIAPETQTPLSKELADYLVFHDLEETVRTNLEEENNIEELKRVFEKHLERLKDLVIPQKGADNDFMDDKNQLKIKQLLEEMQKEIENIEST